MKRLADCEVNKYARLKLMIILISFFQYMSYAFREVRMSQWFINKLRCTSLNWLPCLEK